MIAQNKRLAAIALAVPLLLLVPFTAMQFTHEVNWSLFDFVVAGFLLLSTGLLCEVALRYTRQYRTVILVAILLVFALVWIELAVGIFGTPFAGN